MPNPFYVNPMADRSQALGGLAQSIRDFGQARDAKAEQQRELEIRQKAEQKFNTLKTDLQAAWDADDPDAIAELAIQNPEYSQMIDRVLGMQSDKQKRSPARKITSNMYLNAWNDPENALMHLGQGMADLYQQTGKVPPEMVADIGFARKNPQGFSKKAQMMFSFLEPMAFKAMQQGQSTPGSVKTIKSGEETIVLNPVTGEEINRYGPEKSDMDKLLEGLPENQRQTINEVAKTDPIMARKMANDAQAKMADPRTKEAEVKAREAEAAAKKAHANYKREMQTRIEVLKRAIRHPGRRTATGKTSMFPTMPGSQSAGYEKLLDQIKSGEFVSVLEKMRGLGSLSNAEGAAATAAATALALGQPEGEHLQELERLLKIYENALNTAPGTYAPSGEYAVEGQGTSTKDDPAPGVVNWNDL